MKRTRMRLALRVTAMILLGVLPSALLTIFLVLLLAFGGSVPSGVDTWLVAMIVLGSLGTAGLWGAAFQNEEDRALPAGVTVVLLVCGLLAAAPMLIDLLPSALGDGAFETFSIFLLGPVACAVYFLVERVVLITVRKLRASNNNLEGDACKAARASG